MECSDFPKGRVEDPLFQGQVVVEVVVSELGEIWDAWVIDIVCFFFVRRCLFVFITPRGYCEFREGFYEINCARIGFLTFAAIVE